MKKKETLMRMTPHILDSKTDKEKLWKTGGGEWQIESKPEEKLGELDLWMLFSTGGGRAETADEKQKQQADMEDEYQRRTGQ